MGTLPGEALCLAPGFTPSERMVLALLGGEKIRFEHMGRDIP